VHKTNNVPIKGTLCVFPTNTGKLDLEAFRFKDKLNPNLKDHPQLEWLRKKQKEKKKRFVS